MPDCQEGFSWAESGSHKPSSDITQVAQHGLNRSLASPLTHKNPKGATDLKPAALMFIPSVTSALVKPL